jgi:hypothetical protein
MAKKKEKPAPAKAAEATDAPKKKRSPLKLAILVLAPVMLAGGGYFGWTFFTGEAGEASAHASEATEEGHGSGHGGDGHGATTHVVALPPEIAAESTFTYSFAMSELLNGKCGRIRVKALKAAVAEEASTDGTLVNLSWIAANRRMGTLTEKSCEYLVAEIENADGKAHVKAEEKAAAAKAAEGGGHEAPAAHH